MLKNSRLHKTTSFFQVKTIRNTFQTLKFKVCTRFFSGLIPENEYKIELFQSLRSFTASTNHPIILKTQPIIFTAAVENLTAFGGEINLKKAFQSDFEFDSVFKNLLLNISRDDDGMSTTTRFYKIDDIDKLFVLEDLLPESKYHLNIRGTLINGNRPYTLSTIIFNTSPPDPKFFPTISSGMISIFERYQ